MCSSSSGTASEQIDTADDQPPKKRAKVCPLPSHFLRKSKKERNQSLVKQWTKDIICLPKESDGLEILIPRGSTQSDLAAKGMIGISHWPPIWMSNKSANWFARSFRGPLEVTNNSRSSFYNMSGVVRSSWQNHVQQTLSNGTPNKSFLLPEKEPFTFLLKREWSSYIRLLIQKMERIIRIHGREWLAAIK